MAASIPGPGKDPIGLSRSKLKINFPLWRLAARLVRGVTKVGYVLLQGREPFDLVADRLPSAVAVNGLVAATVPIYAPGLPGNVADVRILLNPQQAEDLGRQLLLEAKKARGSPRESELEV